MALTPPKLSKIHILLADGDLYMASILTHMLHTMGFTNVTRASNGQKALEIIENKPVDILITEWGLDSLNGIDLALTLRDEARSPNIMLPIIMMTGRAERSNVEHARDSGITEFVVKPITSAMLFDRIRRVFDHPRDFVIASSYIGPDRRHTSEQRDKTENNRTAKPLFASTIPFERGNHPGPFIISKNHALKNKAGITGSLDSVITREVMSKAQSVIDSYANESGNWIGSDIVNLERAISRLAADLPGANAQAQSSALSIKSRAGTFGYVMASNVAFAAYVFLYHDYEAQNPTHLLILKKHVEVLKVLLAGKKLGNTPEMEEALTSELLRMTAKLKHLRQPPEALKELIGA